MPANPTAITTALMHKHNVGDETQKEEATLPRREEDDRAQPGEVKHRKGDLAIWHWSSEEVARQTAPIQGRRQSKYNSHHQQSFLQLLPQLLL